MKRVLALLVAFVLALIGLFGASAPASAAPTRSAPVVAPGHVTSVTKATKADVASGFATSTAAALYGCGAKVSMDDPDTGTLTSKLSIQVAWQESKTLSGRPVARLSAGSNGIFITNNFPNYYLPVWSFVGWRNHFNRTNPYGYATAWKQFAGGTTIAVSVDANGNIATSGWTNNNTTGGFRAFIENVPNLSQTPELAITLTGAAKTTTEYFNIYADGNCGAFVLL